MTFNMYKTDFKQIGENVQKVINEQGLTDREVAEQLNISEKAVADIINGTKATNMNEITKIAEALGVSVDSVAYFVKEQAKDGKSVSEIQDEFNRIICEITLLETLLRDAQ